MCSASGACGFESWGNVSALPARALRAWARALRESASAPCALAWTRGALDLAEAA